MPLMGATFPFSVAKQRRTSARIGSTPPTRGKLQKRFEARLAMASPGRLAVARTAYCAAQRSATRCAGSRKALPRWRLVGSNRGQFVYILHTLAQRCVLESSGPLWWLQGQQRGASADNGSMELWASGVVVGGKCLRLGCSWWGGDASLMLDPHAEGTLGDSPIPRCRRTSYAAWGGRWRCDDCLWACACVPRCSLVGSQWLRRRLRREAASPQRFPEQGRLFFAGRAAALFVRTNRSRLAAQAAGGLQGASRTGSIKTAPCRGAGCEIAGNPNNAHNIPLPMSATPTPLPPPYLFSSSPDQINSLHIFLLCLFHSVNMLSVSGVAL